MGSSLKTMPPFDDLQSKFHKKKKDKQKGELSSGFKSDIASTLSELWIRKELDMNHKPKVIKKRTKQANPIIQWLT